MPLYVGLGYTSYGNNDGTKLDEKAGRCAAAVGIPCPAHVLHLCLPCPGTCWPPPDDRCATLACRCPRASGTPPPGAMGRMAGRVASLLLVRQSEGPSGMLIFLSKLQMRLARFGRAVFACHPAIRSQNQPTPCSITCISCACFILSFTTLALLWYVRPLRCLCIFSTSHQLRCTLLLALKVGGLVPCHYASPKGHDGNTT